jgi:S-formylglutathione hydrolase FrmB
MRRWASCAVWLAVLWIGPAAALEGPRFADGYGIHVESQEQLDARQFAVRVSTGALQHPVDVRLLLPADYAASPERDYPVLYLFHGTSGRASDWVNAGDAVATTAGLPLIVVMPDAGFDGDGGGWFANWFNGGAYGQPLWETYHIEQLIPWIDANLHTIPHRDGRAVAGLSQGGFGSLSYAARHPDLFTAVAAFSGGCEIDRDAEAIGTSTTIIQYTTTVLSGVADPDAIFGPRATQELNWQAHDPATLVTNLRGLDIELWTGNGEVGPLDPNPPDQFASQIEVVTYGATRLFSGHLDDAGIPHAYNYYGGGTHIWPYWARDLREYVGPLMARFADPPPAPRSISYMSAADRFQQWEWSVEVQRPTPGFSRLLHASPTGFALVGTGTASVRTPPLFAPGTRVRVHKRGRSGHTQSLLTVGTSGRLRLSVPLSDDARPRATRVSFRVER